MNFDNYHPKFWGMFQAVALPNEPLTPAWFHDIKLTPKDIAEFQELYKKETGEEITADQAREYALRLIELVGMMKLH
jgi:hypothetical protein